MAKGECSSSDNHNAQPQATNTQLADCAADLACAEDDLQASSSPQWILCANLASLEPKADICQNNPAQAADRDLLATTYGAEFGTLSYQS